MRKLMVVLAIAALAACTDQPTQPAPPAVPGPQLAAFGAEHGAWVVRFSADDMWCMFWDADGNLVWSACAGISTPAPGGQMTARYWSEGRVANSTGRASFWGPDHYPQAAADWNMSGFGIGLTPEGLLPLCDWNSIEYPEAYTVWPPPQDKLALLICTTNWHYTVSAAGKAMLLIHFDPNHSWRPFATP